MKTKHMKASLQCKIKLSQKFRVGKKKNGNKKKCGRKNGNEWKTSAQSIVGVVFGGVF